MDDRRTFPVGSWVIVTINRLSEVGHIVEYDSGDSDYPYTIAVRSGPRYWHTNASAVELAAYTPTPEEEAQWLIDQLSQ